MNKNWLINTPISTLEIENLRSELKVDRIVAELLLQRNINTFQKAAQFFRPNLDDLHDPFLMKDMDKAVNRINLAIQKNEKILLFGDYDVDGTTAVALMYSFLKKQYPSIDFYIPDRYNEGYGISKIGIDFAKENNFGLIISLDCGIKANENINYAKSLGIDFIVCDHHNPGEILPEAIVLDPKRSDCQYPYKELSGCGVGFKLLQALVKTNNWDNHVLFSFLDLIAISIGADIVPITGENRILCFHGLKQLNENPRTSFKELLTLAKKEFPVNLTNVVFIIAPRINAAGRISSGKNSVQLMISENLEEIQSIAKNINENNTERRELDSQITQEALTIIEENEFYLRSRSTVVFQENWHKGVVGIVASRLIEKHFKPTIVLTESNGKITGSARTVNDFDIHEALCHCEDLLEQFGGHKHAAGLTLKKENLDLFIEKFESIVANTIETKDRFPNEQVDIEIQFNEIFTQDENRMKIPKVKRILNQLEPHGPGNMKPVFMSKNVYSTNFRILKDEHLKISMTQPNSDVVLEGIAFGMASKVDLVSMGIPYDIIYTMEENKWNNKETLQLMIKDIRPTI